MHNPQRNHAKNSEQTIRSMKVEILLPGQEKSSTLDSPFGPTARLAVKRLPQGYPAAWVKATGGEILQENCKVRGLYRFNSNGAQHCWDLPVLGATVGWALARL